VQWCTNLVEGSLHLQMALLHNEYDAPVRGSSTKNVVVCGAPGESIEKPFRTESVQFSLRYSSDYRADIDYLQP
jgi:hypothetical protein